MQTNILSVILLCLSCGMGIAVSAAGATGVDGATRAAAVSAVSESSTASAANSKITVAWYNVENLYDTIRNPLIFDAAYTPNGANNWTAEKYTRKVANIARVLDDLRADVVGMCEVENAEVIHDVMYAQRESYNMIHRHTSDRRGVDLVLLYRPDRFYPTKIEQIQGRALRREFLVVRGELAGCDTLTMCKVTFVLCHMPSLMNSTLIRTEAARSLRQLTDSLQASEPDARIILMGDFNACPTDYIPRQILSIRDVPVPEVPFLPTGSLYSPFVALSNKGYGSYVYRDKRHVYDFIALSPAFLRMSETLTRTPTTPTAIETTTDSDAPTPAVSLVYTGRCGIFARDYMFHSAGRRRGYPMRTADPETRNGGFSDHLPVFLTLEFRPVK